MLVVFFLLFCGFVNGQKYNPRPGPSTIFYEGFNTKVHSFEGADSEKYDSQKVSIRTDVDGIVGDKVFMFEKDAQHYAQLAKFPATDEFDEFVVQYEVRLLESHTCGGAYIKLLENDAVPDDAADFNSETDYVIMFGPDKCGSNNKVHLILKFRNPVSGEIEEKHAKGTPEMIVDDDQTHLYTLVLRQNGSYEIKVDGKKAKSGSFLSKDDFEPPVFPDKVIDDLNDEKPDTWVDVKKISDPDATKPEDWNETAPKKIRDPDATMPDDWEEETPLKIPDPEANEPVDWDEEEDGEYSAPLISNPHCDTISGCGPWEAPMIDNPEYKGKWSAPMIDNPDYIGEWSPKRIENPYYFDLESHPDSHPLKNLPSLGAVAFEIWTMTKNMSFDNVLISTSQSEVNSFTEETFAVKVEKQKANAIEKEKKKREDARSSLLEDGSLKSLFQYVFERYILETALERPLAFAGAFLFVFTSLFYLLSTCCSSNNDRVGEVAKESSLVKETSVKEKETPVNEEENEEEEEEKAMDQETKGDSGVVKPTELRRRRRKVRKD
eukprot:g6225.t1